MLRLSSVSVIYDTTLDKTSMLRTSILLTKTKQLAKIGLLFFSEAALVRIMANDRPKVQI